MGCSPSWGSGRRCAKIRADRWQRSHKQGHMSFVGFTPMHLANMLRTTNTSLPRHADPHAPSFGRHRVRASSGVQHLQVGSRGQPSLFGRNALQDLGLRLGQQVFSHHLHMPAWRAARHAHPFRTRGAPDSPTSLEGGCQIARRQVMPTSCRPSSRPLTRISSTQTCSPPSPGSVPSATCMTLTIVPSRVSMACRMHTSRMVHRDPGMSPLAW
jgi:hypothetical protein